MKNIFIEGVQGAGKSTLLEKLAQVCAGYHVYREGDLCPCELAWCSYMTETEYLSAVERFPQLSEQIRSHTCRENDRYIVAYTRVKTENRGFYSAMEGYEIYNGRIPYDRFCGIILDRYRRFDGQGNIFECALLQNTIETLMLFYEKSDDEIMRFYANAYDILRRKNTLLIYLEPADLRSSIEIVKKERTAPDGNEVWWNAVQGFFDRSPYAVSHKLSGLDGFTAHLGRRIGLEKRIINDIWGGAALILPSKSYSLETILEAIGKGG